MPNAATVPNVHRAPRGTGHWRASCLERGPRGSAGGHAEKGLHSRYLAAWPTQLANAHLQIIERTGHNAHEERPTEVIEAVRNFISANAVALGASRGPS